MQQGLREYIVTLKEYDYLDSFYQDMEHVSYVNNIPRRAISVAKRRPLSRNTHYMLYSTEADLISNDPRVLSVELTPEELGVKIVPSWSQSSSLWNKSSSLSASHRQWGLLRAYEQQHRSGWGSNGTTNVSGNIVTTANGKNVDVVVVDGHINPDHPEFAVNADGTGGSRVVQFNWFSLNPQVNGLSAGTYRYGPYVDLSNPQRTVDNDHGCHVAGTIAGNTHGWAREANVYNISVYPSAQDVTGFNTIDYVRYWHRTKPINPKTGLKNPTITNHSYDSNYSFPINEITDLRFRGIEYFGPFTSTQLNSYGLSTYLEDGVEYVRVPYTSSAWNADIDDAIKDGVIFVAAAGNYSVPLDTPSNSLSRDWNNYVVWFGFSTLSYSRGLWSNPNVIVVGSVNDQALERKSIFSNSGRRVDVYAPGETIISSVNSTNGVTVGDSRNSSYRITKKSGTSMASPQVAGVLATIAEQWQTIKNDTAKEFIVSSSKIGQLTTSTGGVTDPYDLIFGENKFLAYTNLRNTQGLVGPKNNLGVRKSTGHVWPRTNILRYGR